MKDSSAWVSARPRASFRVEQARHPPVGLLCVGHVRRCAQRHVPHVLQEAHAQHGRHGPELAHRERRDALVLLDHQGEQCRVEASVGVRDQLDGDLVHTRVAGKRARTRQLGQLVVVVARQGGAHFVHLLQHDVEVVEQPLAGGADLHAFGRHTRERVVDAAKYALGRGQAREQRPLAAWADAAGQVDDSLNAGEVPAMSRESIRTEQFAEDHIAGGIRRPHVAESRRATPPAAGKPHAFFCSGSLSSSLPVRPIAEQPCDAEYAR